MKNVEVYDVNDIDWTTGNSSFGFSATFEKHGLDLTLDVTGIIKFNVSACPGSDYSPPTSDIQDKKIEFTYEVIDEDGITCNSLVNKNEVEFLIGKYINYDR